MFLPWFNGFKIHPAMLLFISILSVNGIANTSIPDYRQMAQLAEYIGVDYPEAVDSGKVINDGEYQEMLEFSGILITQAKASKVSALVSKAEILEAAIKHLQQYNNCVTSYVLNYWSKCLKRHCLGNCCQSLKPNLYFSNNAQPVTAAKAKVMAPLVLG